jgi:hypothetical protein
MIPFRSSTRSIACAPQTPFLGVSFALWAAVQQSDDSRVPSPASKALRARNAVQPHCFPFAEVGLQLKTSGLHSGCTPRESRQVSTSLRTLLIRCEKPNATSVSTSSRDWASVRENQRTCACKAFEDRANHQIRTLPRFEKSLSDRAFPNEHAVAAFHRSPFCRYFADVAKRVSRALPLGPHRPSRHRPLAVPRGRENKDPV